MSTVVKDLGAVSAYAYAVEKGYTGTEAEFAELMADYAEVGQRAEDAADSALESKTAAQTAATTATNKASEATTAAQTATTKAAEAQADADAAALDASQALSAASTATTKATEATTAAATATSAKTDAVAANTAAQSAKTAAQTAQTGAETAAASVSASAEQIATNTADISQLKSDLNVVSEGLDDEITRAQAEEARIEALFTQPVKDAVSDWLDDHPEATTTVQDGSLTYKKLVTGTLGFVTPEMFGAVGDGVADDTQAIQDALDTGLPVIGTKLYKIGEPNRPYYYPVTISVDGAKLYGKFIDGRTYLTTSNNKDYGAFLIDADNVTVDIEIYNDNDLLPDTSETSNNLSDVGGYAVTIADSVHNARIIVHCEHMNGVYGNGVFTNADITVLANICGYPYAGNVAVDSNISIVVDNCHRAFWGATKGCFVNIQSKNFYGTGNSAYVLICAVKNDGIVYHGEDSVFNIIDTGSTIYNDGASYVNVYNDIGETSIVSLVLNLTGDISNSDNHVYDSTLANSGVITGNIVVHNNMKINYDYSGNNSNRHYSGCNLSVIDYQYSKTIIDTTADILLNMIGLNPAKGAVYFTHLGASSRVVIKDYNAIVVTGDAITINAYQFFTVSNVFTFDPSKVYRCMVSDFTKYLNGSVVT